MQSLKDLIPQALSGLIKPEHKNRTRLIQEWGSIAGAKVAIHTKPTLGKNGELTVWVDQSTLAFELNQNHKPSILKRAQAVLGEKTVTSVRFFVGQLR